MNEHPPSRHPAWKIWSNPVFRRYCRSRLRPQGLGVSLLVTVLIAGFIVAMVRAVGLQNQMDPSDAARSVIIPLLFLQGIILFVLGTAKVLPVAGLNQISWLPLPGRTNRHPASRRRRSSSG